MSGCYAGPDGIAVPLDGSVIPLPEPARSFLAPDGEAVSIGDPQAYRAYILTRALGAFLSIEAEDADVPGLIREMAPWASEAEIAIAAVPIRTCLADRRRCRAIGTLWPGPPAEPGEQPGPDGAIIAVFAPGKVHRPRPADARFAYRKSEMENAETD